MMEQSRESKRRRTLQVAKHGAAVLQAALDRAQLLLDPVEEGAVVVHAVQLPPHILHWHTSRQSAVHIVQASD